MPKDHTTRAARWKRQEAVEARLGPLVALGVPKVQAAVRSRTGHFNGISRRTGIARSTLQRWAAGRAVKAHKRTIEKLETYLGLPLGVLTTTDEAIAPGELAAWVRATALGGRLETALRRSGHPVEEGRLKYSLTQLFSYDAWFHALYRGTRLDYTPDGRRTGRQVADARLPTGKRLARLNQRRYRFADALATVFDVLIDPLEHDSVSPDIHYKRAASIGSGLAALLDEARVMARLDVPAGGLSGGRDVGHRGARLKRGRRHRRGHRTEVALN